MITYNVKLEFNDNDKERYLRTLKLQRFTWNECSKIQFKEPKNSLIILHNKFYKQFRKQNPEIPSNIIIHTIQEVLSAYRSIKSNEHKITEVPQKKHLSIKLTKNTATLYIFKNIITLTSVSGRRIKASFRPYNKLQQLIFKYPIASPTIFERSGEIWLSLSFKTPENVVIPKLACGIDLGIKRCAATSDGKIYIDKKFNGRKRKLRYLKRQLQSKSHISKSAKRHLRKLRHKEQNINKNQTHLIANSILSSTRANILVLEDLTKLKNNKSNKYKKKFNNKLGQVSFYELRRILTYKALLYNKQVITVKPYMTSQLDSRLDNLSGKRVGCRYYGKDGIVLDADINAAINIAKRSKLPVSMGNYLDGQAKVNSPIVGGFHRQVSASLR